MSLYLGKNKVAGNIVVNKESGNEEYLFLSGGTVDGDVTVNGKLVVVNNPTIDNEVVNKGYVDDKVGDYLPLTGGALTGSINVSGPNYVGADTIQANSFMQIGSSYSSGVSFKKDTDEDGDPSLVLYRKRANI